MNNSPTAAIGTAPGRLRPRVIPVLLMRNRMLYKTRKFSAAKYVGDPRNAVRIFNDKSADEIVLLDIDATPEKREPDYATVAEIAGEAFMPMAYGGGIRAADQARRMLDIGIEKIVICARALEDLRIIDDIASACGAQSVVVCLDVKRGLFGREHLTSHSGRVKCRLDPVTFARSAVGAGAGELIVNSVDRDGTMDGYDLGLIRRVADAVDVPVIALGGAGKAEHLRQAVVEAGASAAAAGSLFVFQGPHRAVLITFPTEERLSGLFGS
jgi:cyclase